MKKVFSIFLTLVATSSALGLQGTGEWIKFTSPEGQFSILLPGKPTETQETTPDSEHGPYTTNIFLTKEGDELYIVGWVDYDPKLKLNVQGELEANRDNFLKGFKAKLLTTNRITFGGHPGIEFTAESPDWFIKSRGFVIGRRPYQMIAVTPIGQDRSQNVNKFLSSFQMTQAN